MDGMSRLRGCKKTVVNFLWMPAYAGMTKLAHTIVFLSMTLPQPAGAQVFCGFNFLHPAVCTGAQCNVLISMTPTGEARVVQDSQSGTSLAINFAANSIFELGDNGRMDFGGSGGVQATYGNAGTIAVCVNQQPGLKPYAVNISTGGWFELSTGNRMLFGENNVFALAGGSVIEGRLIVESPGNIGISSQTGDMSLGNVAISAGDGITVSGQGGVAIGELDAGNQGVNITAEGPVEVATLSSDGPIAVTATGDITIDTIGRAQSIDLLINSTTGGTITIGDNQVSADSGPVIVSCTESQQCDSYEIDNGGDNGNGQSGSPDDCNAPDRDPNAPNACVAGGAISPWWLMLLLLLLLRRRIY
jgi:hypothetical protein